MSKYTKICPICQNEFGDNGHGLAYLEQRKYCSNKCVGIANQKPKFVTKICVHCNNEYQVRPAKSISEKQKYCSRACRNKAHPNKGARPHIAVKLLQARERKRTSKLEAKCAKYLDMLGIEYEYQAIIKDKFVVDFRIGNIILQCDGDYWHGHPRFEPLTDKQKQQQIRDASQDKYLQARGYTIIRIWESDMMFGYIASLFS